MTTRSISSRPVVQLLSWFYLYWIFHKHSFCTNALLHLNVSFSVYSEARQSQLSQEGILNVLQFCDKWDAPSVQDYCLNYLDQVVAAWELHPMLALSIGQKFNRRHWLKDALTKLQHIPVSMWIDNSTILSWMSPHEMTITLQLRECMHLSQFELICF